MRSGLGRSLRHPWGSVSLHSVPWFLRPRRGRGWAIEQRIVTRWAWPGRSWHEWEWPGVGEFQQLVGCLSDFWVGYGQQGPLLNWSCRYLG